ncbi:hypothetical protein KIH87_18530 [Paraneptunicella aestuarii]|uniref:hypothetical protein n=1 Tax=Paraneptunicella aestuarii TaxID=2831148 RepID=UPI001E3B29FF|nr:hypothetical protein [Paraneptunicella aestuarii]UAA38631.1 hypothetical protein KIH87_18530 [Paraneptunicella aestuarii]
MQRINTTLIMVVILAFFSQSVAALRMNCVHVEHGEQHSQSFQAGNSNADNMHSMHGMMDRGSDKSDHSKMNCCDDGTDDCSCLDAGCASFLHFVNSKSPTVLAVNSNPKLDFYLEQYSLPPPHSRLRPPITTI